MLKIRKDDEIVVITGKDKGKKGKVLKVLDQKLIVSGINIVKRHTKPNPNKGVAGGIVEQEAAIQLSNVAIYNPQTQKADRVGFKVQEDGIKVRFYKSTNEVIGS
ncbi:MAG: 50S ribosomal protein L24 [Pseudomonadales bacterium]|nr:50S ribosomal protein L24 [Pseudomonadales bacterium]